MLFLYHHFIYSCKTPEEEPHLIDDFIVWPLEGAQALPTAGCHSGHIFGGWSWKLERSFNLILSPEEHVYNTSPLSPTTGLIHNRMMARYKTVIK
jgi:hypothetical protein